MIDVLKIAACKAEVLGADTSTFRVQFSQSGQVTSPVDSLGGQFSDVTGLFVSNFAFAFTGTFVPDMS